MQTTELRSQLKPTLEILLADTGWGVARVDNGSADLTRDVQIDARVRLKTADTVHSLAIEIRPNPRPSTLRDRAVVLSQAFDDMHDTTPCVFVPKLTSAVKQMLQELGISYFDLYGQCRLNWPGAFIERPARDRPLTDDAAALIEKGEEGPSAASVFGTRPVKRHRVLRALLSFPDRQWHQNELANEADVSIYTAHHVVNFLLDSHYADYRGEGPQKQIYLVRPGDLLDAWRVFWSDSWKAYIRDARRFMSLAGNADQIREELMTAAQLVDAKVRFTLSAGGGFYGSYMRDEQIHAYVVGDIPTLADEAHLEPVSRGANVLLMPARDEGLLYLPEEIGLDRAEGNGPVCPVQLYLDMHTAGARYREQAEALRDERLHVDE